MRYAVRAQDIACADALRLLEALTATLAAITGDGGTSSFDPADVQGERACFAIARDADGVASGCGALREAEEGEAGELKRMYARPDRPGAGAAVLAFLEHEALRLGYRSLRLSTRAVNRRAILFYERHGYRRVANFGRYAGREASVCMEKALPVRP